MKWSHFQFIDSMCTQENIDDALHLGLYDKVFEVDENKQFDQKLLIRPFIRSNQGKQITVLRSEKGMINSVSRLHFIFSQIMTNDIIRGFTYISDRFRSINMELKQIESKNNDVLHFRIPYLESQIRIYLLFLFEMMKADQSIAEIDKNKKICKQYLVEGLDDLINDYLTCELQDVQKNNIPEFVQYALLFQISNLPSPDAVQKVIQITNCSTKLINTKEIQFSRSIQGCQITKNFEKIYSLSKVYQPTVFVEILLLIINEANQQVLESKKYSSGLIGQRTNIEVITLNSVDAHLQAVNDILYLVNQKEDFSLFFDTQAV